jgi:hypothetical protein
LATVAKFEGWPNQNEAAEIAGEAVEWPTTLVVELSRFSPFFWASESSESSGLQVNLTSPERLGDFLSF